MRCRWLLPLILLVGCGGSDGEETPATEDASDEVGTAEAGADSSIDSSTADTNADATADANADATAQADADANAQADADANAQADADANAQADADAQDSNSDTSIGADADAQSPDAFDAAFDTRTGPDTAPLSCTAIAGEIHVAPSGSDTTGNGSPGCPYQTITTAVSKATVASTIYIRAGFVTPFRYGEGCTAAVTGGDCDVLPVEVPSTAPRLIFKGTSTDPSETVITSGTTNDFAVFDVKAPGVGFENLTLEPRKLDDKFGTIGIQFDAPKVATGSEAVVKNVVINGIRNFADFTGPAIVVRGGTSPTLGPGLQISGGIRGIVVDDSSVTGSTDSAPLITSTAALPSFVRNVRQQCILVSSPFNQNIRATIGGDDASDAARLHLQDCGESGIELSQFTGNAPLVVKNVRIDSSSSTVRAPIGIKVSGAAGATLGPGISVRGMNALSNGPSGGIYVTSTLTPVTLSGVLATENRTTGIYVGGFAQVTLDGVTSTKNQNRGLHCDGATNGGIGPSVKLSNTTILENGSDGIYIAGSGLEACKGEFGANVVFNTTAHRNANAGLCYMSPKAATVTGGTWSCGLAATAACTPAVSAVQPIASTTCGSNVDYGGTGALTVASAQTCCGFMP